jgi:hypothetical protein
MTAAPPILDLISAAIGAALTIWIFSFAFKDNLLYKLAEHLFLGSAAAFAFVVALNSIWATGIGPLQKGDVSIVIPLLIGLIFFVKYISRYSWVARFGPAFVIGIGLGIAVSTSPESFVLRQVSASFLPLWLPKDPVMTLTNILMTLIVLGGITYFVFTLVPGLRGGKPSSATKVYKALMTIGIYGMMIGFGASFASTIMTRVAFLVGRTLDLIAAPEASVVALILVVIAIAYAYRTERKAGAAKTAQKT